MSRVNEVMRRVAPAVTLRDADDDDAVREPLARATFDLFRAEAAPLSVDPKIRVPPAALPHATATPVATPAAIPTSRAPEPRAQLLAGSKAAKNAKLIVSPEMSPALSAQYRRLAAALHDLQLETGLKIVMVSSAVPREGKTLTIANLALTLSEAYHRRTLLIDADLRCPALHEIFGMPKAPGLANVLANTVHQLPMVPVSQWLTVLPAGQATAAPLAQLTSVRLRTIVDESAAKFDWVLLDTPPIGVLPDAQHVASVSQAILLVIAANATPYTLVQRAIASVGAERIVGTMLNYVDGRQLLDKQMYGRYFSADAASE
jgi:capsular exopolysaccharide synthesis family protein